MVTFPLYQYIDKFLKFLTWETQGRFPSGAILFACICCEKE